MSGDTARDIAVEIELLEGLLPFVRDEVAEVVPEARLLAPAAVDAASSDAATAIRVAVPERAVPDVLRLRCAVAAHLVLTFDVSRPRSLLSPDRLAMLAEAIDRTRRLHPRGAFGSFRISAAGADSADFTRLHDAVAASTELERDDDEGDLLLRFRRSRVEPSGWDALVRLSPRPLSARPWRTFAFPGSLNATVAASMIRASAPTAKDRFLDPMCGSGTIVVERLAAGAPARLVASDLDPLVLAGVSGNLRAARYRGRVERLVSDVVRLPHPDGSFDVISTNLPWGTSVGSHDENRTLYPALLGELRRVAAPGCRAVVLTHEVAVFASALERSGWSLIGEHRVFQKGHHPRMYMLQPS